MKKFALRLMTIPWLIPVAGYLGMAVGLFDSDSNETQWLALLSAFFAAVCSGVGALLLGIHAINLHRRGG